MSDRFPLGYLFNNFSQILPFGSHGKQTNEEVTTKMVCFIEDHSRNISVKVCQNICDETAVNANFYFSP